MTGNRTYKQGDAPDREIVITRLFDAPRELVFKAWTRAEHLEKWWGPTGFTTTTHEFDMRIGGAWRFTMHGPDGVDYPNLISYEEIVPPERLVYSLGAGEEPGPSDFHVTITFATEAGKTRLTMHTLFPTAEAREFVVKEVRAIEGGNQTLDRLGEFIGVK